jgi:hypothetical protein
MHSALHKFCRALEKSHRKYYIDKGKYYFKFLVLPLDSNDFGFKMEWIYVWRKSKVINLIFITNQLFCL